MPELISIKQGWGHPKNFTNVQNKKCWSWVKVQESIFMNIFKRKESRKHRKTLIHVYTSCKQTAPLIDTEKVFRSGICICVT